MSVVVVGAGPAGIRAAETLAAHGVRPVLLDESRRPGGQGHREIMPGLDPAALMGTEAAAYARLHADFAALAPAIDYRPETLVWAADGRRLHLLSAGRAVALDAEAIILATGAMDRVMPLPGWTLPGVYTLGGAQVALKGEGCLIGRRVAFVGSSPLLTLAALQYAEAGAEIAGIFDTTPFAAKLAAGPGMFAASPRTTWRGLKYLSALSRRGVPLAFGVRPVRVAGTGHVEAIEIARGGRVQRIECDAVALGYGLKPETQLAELLGANLAFDPATRLHLPVTDQDGRAGPGLYLAGDGAAIGGADAAEASGRLAALALLADRGTETGEAAAPLRRRVARLRRFQKSLGRAFAWPVAEAAALDGDTVLCRCENVTVGAVREAMSAELGPLDLNRVKAITRTGMGRCQGRVCGPAFAEVVAAHAGCPIAAVGRLRGQAPVKPIPLSAATPAPRADIAA
ncbi:NAD(P)/FAD-dependent oxidoreductase [Acuticoccus kandeliae]|uniref:FAD/NAD(P)-dependent oxidoreductase n=1 Tax=Acuticoccus kandeliae TaxID=2073160 RepID=UPI000D3E2F2B|nr:NAD(P)/FAD-dependent oxidoreductase [Acuticoccus kandeliae]